MFQFVWNKSHSSGITNFEVPPQESTISRNIIKVAPIYWEEHCVECALPDCYKFCSLYTPREDGKCQRLVYGITPNDQADGPLGHAAEVHFKKWAKLEAFWPSRPAMISLARNKIENRLIHKFQQSIQRISRSSRYLSSLIKLLDKITERFFRLRINTFFPTKIDFLYIKFYYPDDLARKMQIEISSLSSILFREVIDVHKGWNEDLIPYHELPNKFSGLTRISISPIDSEPIRLIFSWLDLIKLSDTDVTDNSLKPPETKKVKCVCWDLDNTLWDGVLGDDGTENISFNPAALELMNEFDRRGILQTICSKNEYSLAWKKIVSERIEHFFLFPEIHWEPKSISIQRIAKNLNIGLDSIALIDDSIRELKEVASVLPEVSVFSADQIPRLIERDQFNVPFSNETALRREKYIAEYKRSDSLKLSLKDPLEFIASCKMKLSLMYPVNEDDVNRCLELLQRTNQFNLTGARYNRKELDQLLRSSSHQIFCGRLQDTFGHMGVIIFIAINISGTTPVVEEFVMSCRAAQKFIDIATLQWVMNMFSQDGEPRLKIQYKETGRNKPLKDILFKLATEKPYLTKENNFLVDITKNSFANDYSQFIKIDAI